METSFREKIKSRTKRIGLDVIKLIDEMPPKNAAMVLSKQILRSATAIGSNYRAACRAKSTPDFINKLKIVEEEADETIYWLELFEEAGIVEKSRVTSITNETSEILAIIVASIRTSRDRYSSN